MKKVVVQLDDVVKIFENVTKVQCFTALDFFEHEVKIYQGEKAASFRLSEINGFEVKDN